MASFIQISIVVLLLAFIAESDQMIQNIKVTDISRHGFEITWDPTKATPETYSVTLRFNGTAEVTKSPNITRFSYSDNTTSAKSVNITLSVKDDPLTAVKFELYFLDLGIKDLKLKDRRKYSADIDWSGSDHVAKYQVEYQSDMPNMKQYVNVTASNVTLQSLYYFRPYNVSVGVLELAPNTMLTNPKMLWDIKSEISVKEWKVLPSILPNFRVTKISQQGFELDWDDIEDAVYEIHILNQTPIEQNTTGFKASGLSTSAIVTTTVISVSGIKPSIPSITLFLLLESVPDKISNLKTINVTKHEISLQWMNTSLTKIYQVEYFSDPSNKMYVNTAATSVTLSPLNEDTVYKIQVNVFEINRDHFIKGDPKYVQLVNLAKSEQISVKTSFAVRFIVGSALSYISFVCLTLLIV